MKFLHFYLVILLSFVKDASVLSDSVINKVKTSAKTFYSLREAIVYTKEGLLRGNYFTNKKYYAFFGVRYGQAPIGKYRFRRPLPERPWTGIRDAFKPGNDCPQIHPIIHAFTGAEDCLFLNVYTGALPDEAHFVEYQPVMFFIHGGGFTYGSGNDIVQDPEFLVPKGVVVVTINYRLGPLGFLCVGKKARGNMGIHDQILALKWVQNNIAAFGGDPRRVTVFGFSAGAASVDLLTLSSQATNLFRAAIAQSGSMLNPWANVADPLSQGFRLGGLFGYKGTSTEELVGFLKKIPVKKLIEVSQNVLQSPDDERNALGFNFTPCIQETDNDYDPTYEPILNENPVDILKRGNYRKIPQIKGFTSNEALFFIKNLLYPAPTSGLFNRSDLYFLPTNMDVSNEYNFNVPQLASDIKQKYVRSKPYLDSLVTYGTDTFFVHGITQELRAHVRNGNKHVYAYRFDYDGSFNFAKRLTAPVGEPGVTHGDELGYLFGAVSIAYLGVDLSRSSKEVKLREQMVTLWTNFAKYGNPTPPGIWTGNVIWEPIRSPNNFTYLNIRDTLQLRHKMPFAKRMAFWDSLYDHYGYKLS